MKLEMRAQFLIIIIIVQLLSLTKSKRNIFDYKNNTFAI